MTLAFQNISHRYEGAQALAGINLTAAPGEILSLLGKSGCGKTTLLNLAAGILKVQSGEIRLGDRLLASKTHYLPPEKRPVGLVFQEGALFPHMTVGDNIAFGLSSKENRKAAVSSLLEQIGLPGYEDRYPYTLSGGQQQRVAVARALAPKPSVLLMDEPFANIDIAMRRQLREDIRRVLKAQDCVTILVTHDPEEAIEISDQMAVMDKGIIVQKGTPQDIYTNPKTVSVARLTGEGAVIAAQTSRDKITTDFGVWPSKVLSTPNAASSLSLFVRPQTIELQSSNEQGGVEITDVRQTGLAQIVTLQSKTGQILSLHVSPEMSWRAGQYVTLMPKDKSLLPFQA